MHHYADVVFRLNEINLVHLMQSQFRNIYLLYQNYNSLRRFISFFTRHILLQNSATEIYFIKSFYMNFVEMSHVLLEALGFYETMFALALMFCYHICLLYRKWSKQSHSSRAIVQPACLGRMFTCQDKQIEIYNIVSLAEMLSGPLRYNISLLLSICLSCLQLCSTHTTLECEVYCSDLLWAEQEQQTNTLQGQQTCCLTQPWTCQPPRAHSSLYCAFRKLFGHTDQEAIGCQSFTIHIGCFASHGEFL